MQPENVDPRPFLEKDYHAAPTVFGGVQTWAIKEGGDDGEKSVLRINRNDAVQYNKKFYGIFQSVNSFAYKRRKQYIARVNAWFVEVDKDLKEDTLTRLAEGPLVPTMIIESKAGFHVYWACAEPDFQKAIASWGRIVKRGLIPFYNGDPKASDICRILRVPGFDHYKHRLNPFKITKVFEKPYAYTVAQMERMYPDVKKKPLAAEIKRLNRVSKSSDSFWENVANLDCEYALTVLSGKDCVGNEHYSFRQNSDGTKQIIVNNKPTSCWIDENKHIGSYEDGGPTIAQWLNWFHKDYNKVQEIIKTEFPECSTSPQMKLM